jgi:2,3-bisphosphoglycerate-independent phosphoglycerate mutase
MTLQDFHKPVALIIRDGWGISPNGEAAAEREGNAPLLADTPFQDQLTATCPQSTLSPSGKEVGLPEGQMGNSEVGHLNLGAGRVVYQDLTRINEAIKMGELAGNRTLTDFLSTLRKENRALHLCGLLSDGGVHSHQEHLYQLIAIAKAAGVTSIYVHAFLDGRDTSPSGGRGYIADLLAAMKKIGAGRLATIIGRYFAMDRDQRWDRTAQAYNLMFNGEGKAVSDPAKAVADYYAQGKTDEFLPATVCIDSPRPLIAENDGILCFNFRSDRMRQLSRAILEPQWEHFPRSYHPGVRYVTMTEYDATYKIDVLFPPQSMKNILAEVVSAGGLKQLRMAETEKYPHVTYFFNGGNEKPFPGEDREMVSSPKVATYDMKPEMSALELTDAVIRRLDTGEYDLLILNYANTDMVGHTGNLKATIKAVETVDACVKRVVEKILALGGCALITSDHGNCERMIADDGMPYTAHTTNPVQLFYTSADSGKVKLQNGILSDIAPTILDLLKLNKPPEMTGHSLISFS